jgi:hypothetical protein
MVKSATSGLMQKSNAGTGGVEDENIEAEYIVEFSDEADDSQVDDQRC